MPTEHAISTSRYLLNTSAVLAAGQQLQAMLGKDIETLDYAVTQLEEATKEQDAGATN